MQSRITFEGNKLYISHQNDQNYAKIISIILCLIQNEETALGGKKYRRKWNFVQSMEKYSSNRVWWILEINSLSKKSICPSDDERIVWKIQKPVKNKVVEVLSR